jgi:hypothetical protein
MNEIVPHLIRERSKLIKEQERLSVLIASIDALLNEYSKQQDTVQSNDSIHKAVSTDNTPIGSEVVIKAKKGLSLKESIKNAVLGFERFNKGVTIVPLLLKWYPEKSNNLLNFQTQVSGILSDWGKSGEIVKFQFSPSKKDTVWGKPEWLDENGKPKNGFEPVL